MRMLKQGGIIILYVFISLIIFLLFTGMQNVSFENNFLLLISNSLFTGLIPVFVAFIAMKAYLKNNVLSELLLGCGMLVLGLGSLVSGISMFLHQSDNVVVTVYNICAFLGSVCQLFAASQDVRTNQLSESKKRQRLKLGLSFVTVCLIVLAISCAAVKEWLPPFIDLNGFTRLRYIVLSMAIAFYFAAALLYWKQYRKLKRDEHFWYSLALLMLSIGLLGVLVALGVGTRLGWVGRSAQYIGLVFALISVMSMLKKAKNTGTSVYDVMMEFFSDNEASYMNLIGASPDSIISIDEEYKIFIANTSAEKLFVMKKNPIIQASFLDFLEQPYKNEVKSDFDTFIKTGNSILIGHTKEMMARDTAGRVFPVEISFVGRRLQSKYAGTLIIRDITERANAEDLLRESEQKALELVEELKIADRNKNEFIRVMSHELRNPLAAIVSGLNLMDIAENPEQITRTKEIIDRQIKHMCRLVDDLLDLTRITQNRINLSTERINLNEIAMGAITDIKPQYAEKGVRLEAEMKAPSVFMTGDSVRIAQVISNLLTNSLKFTQEGGTVRLTLDRDNNEAVMIVKDDGSGMSEEIINEVFKPFVQAENTLDRSNGGLGLGLSIVKGIVDLHGGSVIAFSEGPGKGSAFIVRLPISE